MFLCKIQGKNQSNFEKMQPKNSVFHEKIQGKNWSNFKKIQPENTVFLEEIQGKIEMFLWS